MPMRTKRVACAGSLPFLSLSLACMYSYQQGNHLIDVNASSRSGGGRRLLRCDRWRKCNGWSDATGQRGGVRPQDQTLVRIWQ